MFWLINSMLLLNESLLAESVNTTSFKTVLMNLLNIFLMKKAIISSVTDVEKTLCGIMMSMNALNVKRHSLVARCAWEKSVIFANILENSLLIRKIDA